VLIPGRTIGLLIAAALLFAVIAAYSDTFLKPYTLFVVSRQVAQFVLVALAQAVCLVVGGMNLSVGAIGSLTTVALGLCLDNWGLPAWQAVPVALAVGAACGLINGLLIIKVKINSFIVTLSTMFIFMGLRSGISGGNPYAVPDSFTIVGQGKIFGVPYFFLIMLVVLVVVAYMYRNTVFGRRMLATGGNEDAARLSGIRTDRMILGANVLSGLFAALAAVLYASELGSAAPETGDSWLIVSFAVAIIGGTGLNGGVISALGILMGGIIYTLIRHGLIEIKANPYYMNVYLGLLILLAIAIDRGREVYAQRKRQTPDTAAEPTELHSD
jgi:ribose transport system permease protein